MQFRVLLCILCTYDMPPPQPALRNKSSLFSSFKNFTIQKLFVAFGERFNCVIGSSNCRIVNNKTVGHSQCIQCALHSSFESNTETHVFHAPRKEKRARQQFLCIVCTSEFGRRGSCIRAINKYFVEQRLLENVCSGSDVIIFARHIQAQ